ncbi:MAG: lipocalin family protein [Prevotellaceae bacterium]|nr:lipocalin family protein [Prevotellaceae bacterium]
MSVAIVVAALGMSICSCGNKNNEDGDENKDVKTIALTSPANNATIDLSNVANVTFNWSQLEGISGYTLKFSPTESGLASSQVSINAGNVGSYVLTSEAADNFLATNTSAQPGAAIDIYWTVVPTTPMSNVENTVRKFNVKRLPVPVTPVLDISTASLVFGATPASAQSVEITSNIAWNVSVEPSGWLSPSPVSGTSNGTVSFTALANTSAARNATVTISGAGLEPKTISVIQAAAGGGNSADMVGTWNLKILEIDRRITDNNLAVHTTHRYASTFTLNSNGTFTGDVPILSEESTNSGSDETRSWTYANGEFSFQYYDADQLTYRATVTSSELIFEVGTAGSNSYYKAVCTKEAVTLPPIPTTIEPYTGNVSTFYGVWVMTKTEDAQYYGRGLEWMEISFPVASEVNKLTINADGTYTLVSKLDTGDQEIRTVSGTWTYSNGILTTTDDEGTETVMIDAASNASTLIFSSIEVGEYYSRIIFTKVN